MADARHKRETNARLTEPEEEDSGRPAGRPDRPDGDARRGGRGSPLLHPRDPVRSGRRQPHLPQRPRPRDPRQPDPVALRRPLPHRREAERKDAQKLASLASFQRKQTAAQLGRHRQGRSQNASVKRWSTADLNLWSASDEGASNLGILDSGEKVLITGRAADGRAEIVVDGAARWVTADYLSDEKPEEGPRRSRWLLHQRHLGAQRREPQHRQGARGRLRRVPRRSPPTARSVATVSTPRAWPSTSWSAATAATRSRDFVRAHYAELGVSYIIYSQAIWSVDRGGEGWRACPTVARPPRTTTTTSTSRRTDAAVGDAPAGPSPPPARVALDG